MDCESRIRFAIELQRIIDRAPLYHWGGSSNETEGLDCSGFLYLAAHRAGLPVSRTTSLRMAHGHQGWGGTNVKIEDAESLDLAFWTFAGRPDRPHGHCGFVFRDKDGRLTVAHMSQTKQRLVVVPLAGTLIRDLSIIRRLGCLQT